MGDQDENLLLRWSRRKAAARRVEPEPPVSAALVEAAAAPEPVAAPAAVEPTPQSASPAQTAEETVAVEDLPDVDTLTYESDFSTFMRAGVPEMIKRRALRKLWTSNPLLANLDGLNDYDPVSMTFWTELEAAGEDLTTTSRGLHDKIMEAKRAGYEQKVRRRLPPGERGLRQPPTAASADDAPAPAPADDKPEDEA